MAAVAKRVVEEAAETPAIKAPPQGKPSAYGEFGAGRARGEAAAARAEAAAGETVSHTEQPKANLEASQAADQYARYDANKAAHAILAGTWICRTVRWARS
jgi:hypothetical protein